MGRRAVYHLDHRFTVTPETIEQVRAACSPSGKFVWVTTQDRLRVHTLRGVPGKHADVLLPDLVPVALDGTGDRIWVCEIGPKIGSYDGAKRWRLAFRPWPFVWDESRSPRPTNMNPGPGQVSVEEHGDQCAVIAMYQGGGFWAQAFPCLRYSVEPGPRKGVLLHQWDAHFRFLPGDDVRQLAEMYDLWPDVIAATDIVVLNRIASSALYQMATGLGWRKLTLREKRKHGIGPECPQWIRSDDMRLRQNGNPAGVGDYTARAAAAQRMTQTERDGYVMTAHGRVEVE